MFRLTLTPIVGRQLGKSFETANIATLDECKRIYEASARAGTTIGAVWKREGKRKEKCVKLWA